MIDEQRTKALQINEKVRENTLNLESTRTKLMNDIESTQKDFAAQLNSNKEENEKQFGSINLQ